MVEVWAAEEWAWEVKINGEDKEIWEASSGAVSREAWAVNNLEDNKEANGEVKECKEARDSGEDNPKEVNGAVSKEEWEVNNSGEASQEAWVCKGVNNGEINLACKEDNQED